MGEIETICKVQQKASEPGESKKVERDTKGVVRAGQRLLYRRENRGIVNRNDENAAEKWKHRQDQHQIKYTSPPIAWLCFDHCRFTADGRLLPIDRVPVYRNEVRQAEI